MSTQLDRGAEAADGDFGAAQTADRRAGVGRARHVGVSTARGIFLVARRDILVEIRQKSFQWGLGIMVLLVVLGVAALGILSGSVGERLFAGDPTTVAVTSQAQRELPAGFGAAEGDEPARLVAEPVDSATAGAELVRSGGAEALVMTRSEAATLELFTPDGEPADLAGAPTPGASDLVVVGEEGAPQEVTAALTSAPQGFRLEPSGVNPGLRQALSVLFAITFFSGAIGYCQRIAQTVVEEKASRIVEILLATVTPKVIMAGKIIGSSVLALGQMAVLAIAAALTMVATGQGAMLAVFGPAMLIFLGFFAVGFIMLAALYAGAGATVSRQEEVASATMPLMMVIMIPYFAVMFLNDSALAMQVMSYVPFSSPIVMPVRIITGEALWWEPIVSLLILLATTALAIWIGSRIYENSILRIGGRVKLADAMRAER